MVVQLHHYHCNKIKKRKGYKNELYEMAKMVQKNKKNQKEDTCSRCKGFHFPKCSFTLVLGNVCRCYLFMATVLDNVTQFLLAIANGICKSRK